MRIFYNYNLFHLHLQHRSQLLDDVAKLPRSMRPERLNSNSQSNDLKRESYVLTIQRCLASGLFMNAAR